MSLFTATLITGGALAILGGLFLRGGKSFEQAAKGWLRATLPTLLLFGTAAIGFLYQISQLGEADFGNIRHILLIFFAVVGLSAFFLVKDFLAVRGLAILMLLAAKQLLDAAYMQEPASRLFLVTLTYAGIVLALYIGAAPFKLRDWLEWLFSRKSRTTILGSALLAYGVLLTGVAFSY